MGAAADQDPAGPNGAVATDDASFGVEEEDVDGKAHPEGVDAAAARDQQSRAGGLAAQEGQAEPARDGRDRDRQPHTGDLNGPEPAQTAGEAG